MSRRPTLPQDATPLPPALARAWGIQAPRSRGPKPALSLEQVVRATIALADAEGAQAISMNRVAQELGASTMALYRYVESKDELCALAADAASGAPSPIKNAPKQWRDAVVRWAQDMLKRYRRHLWLLDIPITSVPLMPNQLRWLEYLLRALSGAPLSAAEKFSCAILVSGYIRGVAQSDRDLRAHSKLRGAESAAIQQALIPLLEGDHFREVRGVFRRGEYDVDSSHYHQEDVDFGLERILDGIQAFIDARSRGRASD